MCIWFIAFIFILFIHLAIHNKASKEHKTDHMQWVVDAGVCTIDVFPNMTV